MPKYEQVDWDLAACRGEYTNLFYDIEEERNITAYPYINAVRSMCARCPIWFECLAYALADRIEFGIWGGLSAYERKILLRGSKK
jgi:WhiB family redox-sensing transcriptional regulator